MSWTKIDKKNISRLKPGFTVKFHNGYEWRKAVLNEFWISRGYIATGLQGETANFLYPMFGGAVFCDFKAAKNKVKRA